MTQVEFENQLRELRRQKAQVMNPFTLMQNELKEEIAAKHRQIDDIRKDISKLQASLQGYHQRRIALETEWNAKVNAFIKEHEPSTTSNLAEATTLNIVYELRRRGFDGVIQRLGEEPNDYESYDLQKQFHKFEDDGEGAAC